MSRINNDIAITRDKIFTNTCHPCLNYMDIQSIASMIYFLNIYCNKNKYYNFNTRRNKQYGIFLPHRRSNFFFFLILNHPKVQILAATNKYMFTLSTITYIPTHTTYQHVFCCVVRDMKN